jgi:hypothetical protein
LTLLAPAIDARLLPPSHDELERMRFVHPLVRDVLYARR